MQHLPSVILLKKTLSFLKWNDFASILEATIPPLMCNGVRLVSRCMCDGVSSQYVGVCVMGLVVSMSVCVCVMGLG